MGHGLWTRVGWELGFSNKMILFSVISLLGLTLPCSLSGCTWPVLHVPPSLGDWQAPACCQWPALAGPSSFRAVPLSCLPHGDGEEVLGRGGRHVLRNAMCVFFSASLGRSSGPTCPSFQPIAVHLLLPRLLPWSSPVGQQVAPASPGPAPGSVDTAHLRPPQVRLLEPLSHVITADASGCARDVGQRGPSLRSCVNCDRSVTREAAFAVRSPASQQPVEQSPPCALCRGSAPTDLTASTSSPTGRGCS